MLICFMVSMLIYLDLRFHLISVCIFGFNSGYLYFSFKIMCIWLFKITMVHGIHHWDYLRFNVYFFNDIHVDLSMDVVSFRAKTPLNINGTIIFFNKLLSFIFLRFLFKGT